MFNWNSSHLPSNSTDNLGQMTLGGHMPYYLAVQMCSTDHPHQHLLRCAVPRAPFLSYLIRSFVLIKSSSDLYALCIWEIKIFSLLWYKQSSQQIKNGWELLIQIFQIFCSIHIDLTSLIKVSETWYIEIGNTPVWKKQIVLMFQGV